MVDFISRVLTILIISGFFAYGFFSLYKLVFVFLSKRKAADIVHETFEEVEKK